MTLAPFPLDRRRTALAIMYRNNDFIADIVMPRRPVPGRRFTWKEYRIEDAINTLHTEVGRTGRPQQVEFGFDEHEGRCRDYALEDPVPQRDVMDSRGTDYDPLDTATQHLVNWMELDRERRVASVVFDTNSYSPSNVITLAAASDKFDNYTLDPATPANESDPVNVISEAVDSMFAPPTHMVMGRNTYRIMAQHPKIVSAFHGNEGRYGMVPPEFLGQLFQIPNVVVGQAWTNSVARGQGTSPVRLWDQDIAILRIDPTANIESGMTWGMTAQNENRQIFSYFDENIGVYGGTKVRIVESLLEVVAAPEYGFLIKAAHD